MALAAARRLVADASWGSAHYADLASCASPAEAAFQLSCRPRLPCGQAGYKHTGQPTHRLLKQLLL